MTATIKAALAALAITALAACSPMPSPNTSYPSITGRTAAATTTVDDGYTPSQRQAVRKAQLYLQHMAFSQQGLAHQLEYDQFSPADAAFAVQHISVDWNAQAAKKAGMYLQHMAFSQDGLIHQLEYDGFTPAQAAYGAAAALGTPSSG